MKKKAAERYATAREFADDLRRWLGHEPTKARGAWAGRRTWLWARREPGGAAACVVAVVASVLVSAVVGALRERRQEAERQSLIRQAQDIRLKPRSWGWRDEAWELQRKAATIRPDDILRDQAAATLAGLDARVVTCIRAESAALAFDTRGERL